MNADYIEICRVGNLDADFQQVCLFRISEISQYCCEISVIQIQQRKVKRNSQTKNKEKNKTKKKQKTKHLL